MGKKSVPSHCGCCHLEFFELLWLSLTTTNERTVVSDVTDSEVAFRLVVRGIQVSSYDCCINECMIDYSSFGTFERSTCYYNLALIITNMQNDILSRF